MTCLDHLEDRKFSRIFSCVFLSFRISQSSISPMPKDGVDSPFILGLVWFIGLSKDNFVSPSGTSLESWQFAPKHQEHPELAGTFSPHDCRRSSLKGQSTSKHDTLPTAFTGTKWHKHSQASAKTEELMQKSSNQPYSVSIHRIHILSYIQTHRTLTLMNLKGVVGTSSLQTSFKNTLAASAIFIPAW